jgi:predicted RNA-binding Zn-ribbon protein involved in translation (DUF1610 family)
MGRTWGPSLAVASAPTGVMGPPRAGGVERPACAKCGASLPVSGDTLAVDCPNCGTHHVRLRRRAGRVGPFTSRTPRPRTGGFPIRWRSGAKSECRIGGLSSGLNPHVDMRCPNDRCKRTHLARFVIGDGAVYGSGRYTGILVLDAKRWKERHQPWFVELDGWLSGLGLAAAIMVCRACKVTSVIALRGHTNIGMARPLGDLLAATGCANLVPKPGVEPAPAHAGVRAE